VCLNRDLGDAEFAAYLFSRPETTNALTSRSRPEVRREENIKDEAVEDACPRHADPTCATFLRLIPRYRPTLFLIDSAPFFWLNPHGKCFGTTSVVSAVAHWALSKKYTIS